jgi:hypothetical protein
MRLRPHDLDELTNEHLFMAFSVGCNAGRFDNENMSEDSIAEQLIKRTRYGAVAAVFNARSGWFDPRQVWRFSGEFQAGILENLVRPSPSPIGVACSKARHDRVGLLEAGGFMPYRWCYYQLNLFGDPHLTIQTRSLPQ